MRRRPSHERSSTHYPAAPHPPAASCARCLSRGCLCSVSLFGRHGDRARHAVGADQQPADKWPATAAARTVAARAAADDARRARRVRARRWDQPGRAAVLSVQMKPDHPAYSAGRCEHVRGGRNRGAYKDADSFCVAPQGAAAAAAAAVYAGTLSATRLRIARIACFTPPLPPPACIARTAISTIV